INQFLTVEQPGTQAVKAIFPIVPMSDAYRDVTWAGGNTDFGFIPLWLGLVNGLALVPAQDALSEPQIALNAESQHALDVAAFAGPALLDATLGGYEMMLPSALQTFPEQAYDGPFYQLRSPIRNISRVAVPTFIVGGTYDLFQRGEPILFRGLKLSTARKKLMIGPWYHISAGNGLTADDGSNPVYDTKGNLLPSLNNLQLAWFDHWLKGINNGIDAFPAVAPYYLGAGKWPPDPTYPARRAAARPRTRPPRPRRSRPLSPSRLPSTPPSGSARPPPTPRSSRRSRTWLPMARPARSRRERWSPRCEPSPRRRAARSSPTARSTRTDS